MMINSTNRFLIGFVGFLTFSIIITGCGSSDKPEDNQDEIISDTTQVQAEESNTQKVFYSIPSPLQLAKLLQKSGAAYNKEILSSPDKASNFVSSNSKALNLGVFGADLSYSAIFSESQQTMNYLKSSRKLAEELGITSSFTNDMMKRMETNVSVKDSILPLISEVFLNSDEALKENAQSNISTLVLAGGFIEGLYLATKVSQTIKKNQDIVTRVAELKGALSNLILMLSTEEKDAEIVALTKDLNEIKEIYNQMEVTSSDISVKADSTKNKMTIGGKAKYNLTGEQLEKISTKIEALRNKIIKP